MRMLWIVVAATGKMPKKNDARDKTTPDWLVGLKKSKCGVWAIGEGVSPNPMSIKPPKMKK